MLKIIEAWLLLFQHAQVRAFVLYNIIYRFARKKKFFTQLFYNSIKAFVGIVAIIIVAVSQAFISQ